MKLDHVCRVGKGARAPVVRVTRKLDCARRAHPVGCQWWGAQQIFLEMPNTTYAWCTCDLCATSDFWTLKRNSSIKRYPSGVCPSPARETAPGFSLRGRGAPQLNTPVVAPVMCLFGGRRDSLFVNPFKKVTKSRCKFHLLQGACSSPVVCSARLFLPCSLQGYRAATAAAQSVET
jgi:hypothetical protein